MYVCMYVIFIRCDKCTSNNKHKKQSQNDVQQAQSSKTKKTISLDKAIQRTDKKRFLMKISRILAAGMNVLEFSNWH